MALVSTTIMIKSPEQISGDLTAEERATLQPMQIAMHSGAVTQLTSEQVEALDAMYSAYFGSTV